MANGFLGKRWPFFFGFLWIQNGHEIALKYVSAYLMEWSLSIDNIFVFILIFGFFRVKEKFYARVLLIGILMAIIFRIVFLFLLELALVAHISTGYYTYSAAF